jgi:hypothetical protein
MPAFLTDGAIMGTLFCLALVPIIWVAMKKLAKF